MRLFGATCCFIAVCSILASQIYLIRAVQPETQVCPATTFPPNAGIAKAPHRLAASAAARGTSSLSRFIVRFNSYKPAHHHWQQLAKHVAGEHAAWHWVARNNAAARFPTDFGLLDLDIIHVVRIKDELQTLPFVKDVHVDRQLRRPLTVDSSFSWDDIVRDNAAPGPAHGYINDEGVAVKKPGRLQTHMSFGLHADDKNDDNKDNVQSVDGSKDDGSRTTASMPQQLNLTAAQRRKLLNGPTSITALLKADKIWAMGHSGGGVRMGVFDTGIKDPHPHVRNIRERTNWTHEPTLEDGLGHGTFVAGVIAGQDAECPGLAPDVELYTFRVFTNDQVSYTSWFLDAFNYAMATKMHVVNLSIGGPDYLDRPFVDKVLEITSNGILMVSAIGNDGPLYGTLNNPADQNDVIGVGGIDYNDNIASFSSRGMSTWELPLGYGRSKPDVMAYGRDVRGSRILGGCRSLSGTSVASPVVAGAVCLLASTVPESTRWSIINPASMKQALVEGATRVNDLNMYEQGQGKLNLVNSMQVLAQYTPRASVVPSHLDLTSCPYAWPFCKQPLYAHAMPTMFNATILNGMALTGTVEQPPTFTATNEGGKLLSLQFEYSELLWPWSGYLALYISVLPQGEKYEGIATGEITFTVVSPPACGEKVQRRSQVKMQLTAKIISTPPRAKRVLFDQFHSMKYPPGYLPRDNLDIRNDILDWHGDHIHTNYHGLYDFLRDNGYFVEVLASPFTCFDADQYGTLLLVDSEEEYYADEITKLERDVHEGGLALIVFGEWYELDTMQRMRFFDDNTRSWWSPVTGGANVPALNDLLRPYAIAFGSVVGHGAFMASGQRVQFTSGANIAKFPRGGYVFEMQLENRASESQQNNRQEGLIEGGNTHAVLGAVTHGSGKVVVYGDSNCLDSNHMVTSCYALLQQMIAWGTGESTTLPADMTDANTINETIGDDATILPTRRDDINFTDFSLVLSTPLRCYRNSLHGMLQHATQRRYDEDDDDDDVSMRDDDIIDAGQPSSTQSWNHRKQRMAELPPRPRGNSGRGKRGAATDAAGEMQQQASLLMQGMQASVALAVLGILLVMALWHLTRRRNSLASFFRSDSHSREPSPTPEDASAMSGARGGSRTRGTAQHRFMAF